MNLHAAIEALRKEICDTHDDGAAVAAALAVGLALAVAWSLTP